MNGKILQKRLQKFQHFAKIFFKFYENLKKNYKNFVEISQKF